MNLQETLAKISPLDESAMQRAKERLDGLLKPPGSLGKLEDLAVRLAGIYGEALPQLKPKAIIMMAADNGVYEEGFNAYPQEITKAVAELAGPGTIGVSVLSRLQMNRRAATLSKRRSGRVRPILPKARP